MKTKLKIIKLNQQSISVLTIFACEILACEDLDSAKRIANSWIEANNLPIDKAQVIDNICRLEV